MRTDKKRCFTGRIRFNADRIGELNFILDDAVFCELCFYFGDVQHEIMEVGVFYKRIEQLTAWAKH